jgi:hypothetical protein
VTSGPRPQWKMQGLSWVGCSFRSKQRDLDQMD